MSKSWRFTTYHDYKDGDKDDSDDNSSSGGSRTGSEAKKVDVKHPTSDEVDGHRKTEKELPDSSSHKSEDRHKRKKHHHKSHKKEKRKAKSRSRSRDRDLDRRRSKSRSRSRERRDESRDKSRRHYRNHRDEDRSYKSDKRPSSYHEYRPSQSRSSDYSHGGSHSSSTTASSSRGGFTNSRGRYVDPSNYVDDRLKSGPLPTFTDKSQLQAASLGLKTVPVEAVKLKEEIEKRKLLWSKKEKPAEAVVPVVWKQTAFSDDKDGKQSEKFRRLMGMKGGGTFVGPQNKEDDSSPEKSGASSLNQDEYFANLERQYEVARATTHTQRGLGLGFSSRKYL